MKCILHPQTTHIIHKCLCHVKFLLIECYLPVYFAAIMADCHTDCKIFQQAFPSQHSVLYFFLHKITRNVLKTNTIFKNLGFRRVDEGANQTFDKDTTVPFGIMFKCNFHWFWLRLADFRL